VVNAGIVKYVAMRLEAQSAIKALDRKSVV
jgi:hypothetical protein